LALGNGGTLPSPGALKTMGHGSLYSATRKHPHLFAHIKQDSMQKSIEEWVKFAEKLASENNGVLPSPGTLQKSSHSALCSMMRKSPKLFSHIPQEFKGGKTPEEWVPFAQELAEKNGGSLPSSSSLRKDGYGGLAAAIRLNPQLFSKQYVTIAASLASEHGGVLPKSYWLRMNGYDNLYLAMRKDPDAFKGVAQNTTLRKVAKDWVPFAEDLSKKHNGLPTRRWLLKNKCSGLVAALGKHPSKFAHIPRQFNTKGIETPKAVTPMAAD
jgi:hypothetical protein